MYSFFLFHSSPTSFSPASCMDDVFDEESDDLCIASRDFQRQVSRVSTAALREGSLAGREDKSIYSAAYHDAFQRAIQTGQALGRLQGRFQALKGLGLLEPGPILDDLETGFGVIASWFRTRPSSDFTPELRALEARLNSCGKLPDDVRGLCGLSLGTSE